MNKSIEKITVVTFPVLFIRALSKDYDSANITWDDLLNRIFIKDTDIYREMYVTFHSLGIELDKKIRYEKTFNSTKNNEIVFELEELNGTRVLTNLNTKEQIIVPKKATVNLVLTKMGYTQKIKKYI